MVLLVGEALYRDHLNRSLAKACATVRHSLVGHMSVWCLTPQSAAAPLQWLSREQRLTTKRETACSSGACSQQKWAYSLGQGLPSERGDWLPPRGQTRHLTETKRGSILFRWSVVLTDTHIVLPDVQHSVVHPVNCVSDQVGQNYTRTPHPYNAATPFEVPSPENALLDSWPQTGPGKSFWEKYSQVVSHLDASWNQSICEPVFTAEKHNLPPTSRPCPSPHTLCRLYSLTSGSVACLAGNIFVR